MDQTGTLSQGFYGSETIQGLPHYVTDGLWKTSGIVADSSQTAYFGRVVSSADATPNDFVMGAQAANFMGILINEAGINQNDPFKNNYRLQYEPVTAIRKGAFWIKGWTSTATGALTTPTKSSVVIYSNTTGQLEFIASTTAVPSGWTVLKAEILCVDTGVNGVLVWLGENLASGASSTKTMSYFSIVVTGAAGWSEVANIVESTGAVSISVPSGTTVTALVANFIYSGSTIKVSTTAQVSGVTANDFTSPVEYVVTAADGTTKTYTVTVTVRT